MISPIKDKDAPIGESLSSFDIQADRTVYEGVGSRVVSSSEKRVVTVEDVKKNKNVYIGLLKTFLNRTDIFPVKYKNKYFAHGAPTNLNELLLSHLGGNEVPATGVICKDKSGRSKVMHGSFRVGAYNIGLDGRCRWSCVDFDGSNHKYPLANPEEAVVRVYEIFLRLGLASYIEISGSGSGFHLWTFFESPQYAAEIRRVLFKNLPKDIPLLNGDKADPWSNRGIEVFPKQDFLGQGSVGNFVWLPWWAGAVPGANQFVSYRKDHV